MGTKFCLSKILLKMMPTAWLSTFLGSHIPIPFNSYERLAFNFKCNKVPVFKMPVSFISRAVGVISVCRTRALDDDLMDACVTTLYLCTLICQYGCSLRHESNCKYYSQHWVIQPPLDLNSFLCCFLCFFAQHVQLCCCRTQHCRGCWLLSILFM